MELFGTKKTWIKIYLIASPPQKKRRKEKAYWFDWYEKLRSLNLSTVINIVRFSHLVLTIARSLCYYNSHQHHSTCTRDCILSMLFVKKCFAYLMKITERSHLLIHVYKQNIQIVFTQYTFHNTFSLRVLKTPKARDIWFTIIEKDLTLAFLSWSLYYTFILFGKFLS